MDTPSATTSSPKRQKCDNGTFPHHLSPSASHVIQLREVEMEKWILNKNAADQMVPLLGALYLNHNVICTLFGKGLVNCGSIEIIKQHFYVEKHLGFTITPVDSLVILNALMTIPTSLDAMRIDLGRTFYLCADQLLQLQATTAPATATTTSSSSSISLSTRLGAYIASLMMEQAQGASLAAAVTMSEPRDVVLYGFGRIGRLLARLLIEKAGGGVKLMLRAIVVRKGSTVADLKKRASLLRRDSIHGPFAGTITFNAQANAFIANGNVIQIIYAASPEEINYHSYGIQRAIVIDNTGVWRTEAALGRHLAATGVSKVILTAPAKEQAGIVTVVPGVNDSRVTDSANLYSAASCTTNAITPCLMAMDLQFGIRSAHIETVHSFTNDQNLIDNYHSKERRGRSAVLNMILTETGAASAVVNVIPSMTGKLTANAIRVPTPNVSMAILILQCGPEAMSPTSTLPLTVQSVNDHLRQVCLHSAYSNQMDYIESTEVASSDFVGSRAACIVDANATKVNGSQVNLYLWYDNEFGYSCQVIRLLQQICHITHARFPDTSQATFIDAALGHRRVSISTPRVKL